MYCIRDPVTSKEKVVHRNLLLPVGFLPVGGDGDLETSCSSVAGSGQSDPVVSLAAQNSETKTVNWLLQMDDANDGDEIASLIVLQLWL